jgi:P27 family predicted phage terminase small subunit
MKGRKPPLTVIDGGFLKGRCPSAPDWFTPQAKAEWQRSAPHLFKTGQLHPDTMATLEAYCVAAGMVRETEEIMGREGRMEATDKGQKPHAAFKMQSAAMREARLLAAELGLTPHRRRMAGENEGKSTNDQWDTELLA